MLADTESGAIPNEVDQFPLVVDRLQQLKNKLIGLHSRNPKSGNLFRLGYTLLLLEKSLEERGLTWAKMSETPAIRRFLEQLAVEIDLAASQKTGLFSSEADIRASDTRLVSRSEEPQRMIEGSGDDGLPGLMAELQAIQKWQRSESRRLFSSIAAQFSAIERLSERMTRLERELLGHRPLEERPRRNTAALQSDGSNPQGFDPRPLLAAARAAAQRTFPEIPPNGLPDPVAFDAPSRPTSPTTKSEPLPRPLKRGFKFLFTAA
jgi:hypothetical protein